MNYRNAEMKLDQLIGYFSTGKINLIPPFQRGHVWKLDHRKRLLANMVSGRPIPAIFLYKEAAGSQFEYNILDGKQRLESLILFIGTKRADLRVPNVRDFFFNQREREQIGFSVPVGGEQKTFSQLSDELVRNFGEYAIPTIEIELDDDTTLDEIINLFVDINQQGAKVRRFDIVKAIGKKTALLRSVFTLVAQEQTRKRDKFFKPKDSSFTRVLERLQVIANATDQTQKVDRIWERLFEIVLFNRTGRHRQPNQIFKTFIKTDDDATKTALTGAETRQLNRCFTFLDKCYAETELGETRLARDLPHFYTMATTLLKSELLEADGAAPDYLAVRQKLLRFAKLLNAKATPANLVEDMKAYKDASERQTLTLAGAIHDS